MVFAMKENEAAPPEFYLDFVQRHPEVASAHEKLGLAVRKAGPLAEREIALVKLAIAIGARMEGAVHAHSRKALAAGVEPEAVEQAVLLACPTIGFPNMMAALSWTRDALRPAGGESANG
jgi:alkylhydroperoxidase/carboxymuconolactone decarboxylase family protein YurZ